MKLISNFGKNFTCGFNFVEVNFQGFAKKTPQNPQKLISQKLTWAKINLVKPLDVFCNLYDVVFDW